MGPLFAGLAAVLLLGVPVRAAKLPAAATPEDVGRGSEVRDEPGPSESHEGRRE